MGKLKSRLEGAPRHGWHGESAIPNLELLRAGTLIQMLGSCHIDDEFINGIYRSDYSYYPVPEDINLCFMIVDIEEGNLRHRTSRDQSYMGYRVHLDDASVFELLPSSYLNKSVSEVISNYMIDYMSIQGVCYRVISSIAE